MLSTDEENPYITNADVARASMDIIDAVAKTLGRWIDAQSADNKSLITTSYALAVVGRVFEARSRQGVLPYLAHNPESEAILVEDVVAAILKVMPPLTGGVSVIGRGQDA